MPQQCLQMDEQSCQTKRRSQRFSCQVPIDTNAKGFFSQSYTIDISKKGLGLLSKQEIPVNQEVPIELDASEGGYPVIVIGKVLWSRFSPEHDMYRSGVAFTDVFWGSKTRLSKTISQQYFNATD